MKVYVASEHKEKILEILDYIPIDFYECEKLENKHNELSFVRSDYEEEIYIDLKGVESVEFEEVERYFYYIDFANKYESASKNLDADNDKLAIEMFDNFIWYEYNQNLSTDEHHLVKVKDFDVATLKKEDYNQEKPSIELKEVNLKEFYKERGW